MYSKLFSNKWKDSWILSGGGLTVHLSGRREIWFKILYSESLLYRAVRKFTAAHWRVSISCLPPPSPEPRLLDPTQGKGIERGNGWSSVLCSFLHGLIRCQTHSTSGTCEPSHKAARTTVCIPKINFSNSMCIRIIRGPLWKCSSQDSTLGHSNTVQGGTLRHSEVQCKELSFSQVPRAQDDHKLGRSQVEKHQ